MTASNPSNNPIAINVATAFLAEQSAPEYDRYAFSYTITITNNGEENVQLLSRHWLITDSDNRVQEVRGEGVVGQQPTIPPGESYQYTSGAILETAAGTMEGSYQMISASGELFEAPIATFSLIHPSALH
ncbi:Co2+/Mg2+ efflux protein ApaG [Dasania sp. GY-MA-18]|uniref:Protein ApaG n=1 Tax=Dasania phycosphaerae TaxID=2950436 RepID=A0A9J6RK62_9GAMM|nr:MULTISPECIES: Co2+/Mg2+ efflux protein ApaG [Dasania]MCR8922317.1 Co2+/Mg2+ efflux protein ApaG [Dasania sp. GY-MA-18]MCZ0864745.1 Co2+/Mg2+ efflux protein ApaG [Dasania phycosphaerae]MCZ0868473.1 Co2+/Mg2+ efflux protein ApaG [Dasania phycosphaerae]